MKDKLSILREYVWPLLEKSESRIYAELQLPELTINEENIEKILDLTLRIYETELERSNKVETKSSLFIGTLSVVTSVVLAVTATLINNNAYSTLLLFIVFSLFVLTLYIVRTIWFSIKVLERKTFSIFHYNDVLIDTANPDYYKKLIITLVNKTNANSGVINEKVSNMTMAQEYFKRVMITIALYAGLVLLFFIAKSKLDIISKIRQTIEIINVVDFGAGLIILLVAISLISIIINFILIKKLDSR